MPLLQSKTLQLCMVSPRVLKDGRNFTPTKKLDKTVIFRFYKTMKPKQIIYLLLVATLLFSCKKNQTTVPDTEKPIVPTDARWKQLADIPFKDRTSVFTFSIGAKAYVVGGVQSGTPTKELWEYDAAIDKWTQKASYPGNAWLYLSGFVINNKAYIGTGFGNNANSISPDNADMYEYDPATDKWMRKTDFPGVAREGASGFSIDGKGYFGLGSNNVLDKKFVDFYRYDPTADSWSRVADYPGEGQFSNLNFSTSSKGYVAWGLPIPITNKELAYKDIWEYNAIADKWIRREDFSGNLRSGSAGITIGNNFYIGPGVSLTGGIINDLWKYDTGLDKWSKETEYPDKVGWGMIYFSTGNSLYMGAGGTYEQGDNGGKIFKHFWKFTP